MKYASIGVVVSILFFLFISFSPTVYELFNQVKLPSNRVLLLEHGYTPDFNLYLSKIRQGQEGKWMAVELYDNMPHRGSLLQVFYLLIGKIGGVFGLSPIAIYHASRVVFGGILLGLMYLLAVKVLNNRMWALVGLWMIVTVSSWPVIDWSELSRGIWGYGSSMPWWTIIDPLKRITITPHLLAGQSLLLYVVYMFFYEEGLRRSRWIRGIRIAVVGIVLGLVFPPALLMAYGVMWGTVALKLAFRVQRLASSKEHINYLKDISSPLIFTIFSLPTLLYLSYLTSFYPWKRLNDYNELYPTYFPIQEFVLVCGPWLVLVGVSVLKSLSHLGYLSNVGEQKEKENILPMVVWIGGIFVAMVVIRFIPQQNALRFTQVAHFVPIGILATYVVKSKWENLKAQSAKLKVQNHNVKLKAKKTVLLMIVSMGVVLGLGHMGQSLYWQIKFVDAKVAASIPEVPRFPQLMYPTTEFMDALAWIEHNTAHDSVIFAEETFGNYVPAYTGRKVYCCHANTPQSEEHLNNVIGFYYGWSFGSEKAKEWLHQQHVTHIVWGPQEIETANRNGGTDIKVLYPWLEEAYRNGRFTVFEISKSLK